MKSLHASLLALALVACGSPDESPVDASSTDANVVDASPSDSGSRDASSLDASTDDDASTEDASTEDASTEDASAEDDASTPDANVEEDAGTPSSGSCDARRVLCFAIPPKCAENEAPSVVDACWGPCILATSCTCSNTDECPIVPGFSEVCYTGPGHCGPLL